MPADTMSLGIKLIGSFAIDVGQRFSIHEGDSTIGTDVVSQIDE